MKKTISGIDVATGNAEKPKLITSEEAKQLSISTVQDLFVEHMNSGQMHFLKLLGFDRVLIESAEGALYRTRDGREILDFFGGFGSVACGHNHPRILAARKKFQDDKLPLVDEVLKISFDV